MTDIMPFIISLLMGLLVGIERQKAHPRDTTALGIRSFSLISLLGALAGWIGDSGIAAIAAVFVMALIFASYFLGQRRGNRDKDIGLTTEFAAGIVFLLGFGANISLVSVSLLGPVVALILFAKKPLHSLSNRIQPSELEAVLLLLLMGVGVLSLVPDKAIDDWGIFNPKKYGLLILVLATLEFSGYVTAKVFGHLRGIWLVGLLGGLVSSTAVTLSNARAAKEYPQNWFKHAGAIMAAQLSSLMALIVVTFVSSPRLGVTLAGPIVAASLVALGALFWCTYGNGKALHTKEKIQDLGSPLDLKNVLRLSLLMFAILTSLALVKRLLGDQATQILALLTGLFELHGISVATSSMYSQGQLTIDVASTNIVTATIASFVAKAFMTMIIERGRLARFITMTVIAMSIAAIAANMTLNF